jgi:mono/diheme cytochrome c family protein
MENKSCLTLIFLLMLSFTISPVAMAVENHPGQAVFAQCAACHLPSGQGIPGAFPPIADRIGRYAETDEGRAYLVGVISGGLIGSISIAGVDYSGAMPGLSGLLNDQAIGDVLNYVMQVLSTDSKRNVIAFSSAEVSQIKQLQPNVSGSQIYRLRQQLIADNPTLK